MNKLILCEGATDAILLSYYLERVAGWKCSHKNPQGTAIRATKQNESANWHKKDGDYLLICAVGGKDNFKSFFDEKIREPILVSDAFEKIAFVADRDSRKTEEIETAISSGIEIISAEVKNNQWVNCSYVNRYGIEKFFKTLLVIIPNEQQGALETAMLSAIAEKEYDKNIVEKSGEFAEQMSIEASRYISSERLKIKAHLGLTWAVQYPEKVFSKIDEQIRNVRWEESEALRTCFSALIEI